MQLYTQLVQLSQDWITLRHPVLTIGNFDGIHRGHQVLLEEAKALAHQHNTIWGALCFYPHPKEYFGNENVANLQTMQQKIEGFSKFGASFLCIQKFDQSFCAMSPAGFLDMLTQLDGGISGLVVGYNFRFGAGRTGDVELLRSESQRRGIDLKIASPVLDSRGPISSTRIRKVLGDTGDVREASQLLGRPYRLTGIVQKGKQLGRTIGIPTANIHGIDQLIPKSGVYAGFIQRSSHPQIHPAVINIGQNPTVTDSRETKVEAHAIDTIWDLDALYQESISLSFVERLRSEIKFASIHELRNQIDQDIAKARLILEQATR